MNRNETATESKEAHDEADAELGVNSADLRHALDAASDLARESPHAALAIAVAAGFILGGGLTPRLVGSVAMIAGRTYLGKAMRETMTTVVQEQLAGARG